MIFDSHAHYNDESFSEDQKELLQSLKEKGVGEIVNISSDKKSLQETIELTKQYAYIYGALGIHPSDSGELTEQDLEELRQLCITYGPKYVNPASEGKIVAIGEIGLDYYWKEPSPEVQKKWFRAQLALARELQMPVSIHSRDACQDTLDILREFPEVNGVIHCFSYTWETAKEYLAMGYYIGVGGVITFKNAKKLKEAVVNIPLDRIVIETDCPYLAPEPHRGTRNTSLNLSYVIETIAELKGVTPEAVEAATWENAQHLYHR